MRADICASDDYATRDRLLSAMRADICASDDYATRDRLLSAIRALGGEHEGEWEALGVGLHRFRLPTGALTIFIDAWCVDLDGPDELVRQVLQLISTGDRG